VPSEFVVKDESMVRCILERHLQGNLLSPALFYGENVSVSLVSILSLPEIRNVYRAKFKARLARPWGDATVSLSTVKKLEKEIHSADDISLKPSPTRGNSAHAEICPAISLELSTALVEDCIKGNQIQSNGDLPPSVQEIRMG
jgi:hypothetical protein